MPAPVDITRLVTSRLAPYVAVNQGTAITTTEAIALSAPVKRGQLDVGSIVDIKLYGTFSVAGSATTRIMVGFGGDGLPAGGSADLLWDSGAYNIANAVGGDFGLDVQLVVRSSSAIVSGGILWYSTSGAITSGDLRADSKVTLGLDVRSAGIITVAAVTSSTSQNVRAEAGFIEMRARVGDAQTP